MGEVACAVCLSNEFDLLNCTEPAWASENESVCNEREDEVERMKVTSDCSVLREERGGW